MPKLKQHHIYLGLGFSVIVTVATILIITKSGKTKVDLKKFDSPDIPGSGKCMDKHFLKMLTKLQKKTGFPIFKWVISGARSQRWNTKVGGVGNSAHKIPTCKAADIKTPTIDIRDKIVRAAKEIGFKRIGIGTTSIHLDNDATKKQYVAWGYPLGSKPPYNPFG